MNLAHSAISQLLTARGMSVRSLARRTGLDPDVVADAIGGEPVLDDEQVRAVAEQLAVPVHALFSGKQLSLLPSVDYRSPNPAIARFRQGTLEAFAYVERLSGTLASLDFDMQPSEIAAPIHPELTTSNAVELAKRWRKEWGFTIEAQIEAGDANRVYTSLRSFIESMGLIVLHYSFKTDEVAGLYAHVDGGPHTIVINSTKSSKARKLFTLAHEFCHFLLRKEGASNPSILRNKVERFCNKFAAHLLAPKKLITVAMERFGYRPSIDNDLVRLFAKKIGISQEALVRRFVELGYITNDQYGSWRGQFNGMTPVGDQGDGGGRSDPIQTKRTLYGGRLLSLLGRAYSRGDLDDIDIYRLCGLKPKYQKILFSDV